MKRLALVVVCLAALAAPAASLAHPLGNFTVNRFAAVELAGDRVYVRYALDLAEIPTFQERARAERPGFARSLARKLELRLDGRRTPLDVVAARTRLRPGAGGLRTLRFDAVYRARGRGSRLELRDRNYPSRLGWREIVVRARDGAELRSASVPADSTSDELRAYPDDLLSEPLDVKRATAEFALGDSRAVPPRLAGAPDVERSDGGFESLVDGELTAGVIAVSLLVALFWGAAHALTPGHGKAIVAAYLVGTRGTARHALLLGLVVTVTHTLGVFALGLVTLSLSEFIVPETLYPWMNLVSALLVVGVGVAVLRSRARDLRHRRPRAPLPLPRSPPPSPPWPGRERRAPRAARGRHLGRPAALPDRARRPPGSDLAPPRRFRADPHRRVQPRPGVRHQRYRAARGGRAERLPEDELRGPPRAGPAGGQRARDRLRRDRHDRPRAPSARVTRLQLRANRSWRSCE